MIEKILKPKDKDIISKDLKNKSFRELEYLWNGHNEQQITPYLGLFKKIKFILFLIYKSYIRIIQRFIQAIRRFVHSKHKSRLLYALFVPWSIIRVTYIFNKILWKKTTSLIIFQIFL